MHNKKKQNIRILKMKIKIRSHVFGLFLFQGKLKNLGWQDLPTADSRQITLFVRNHYAVKEIC